MTLVTLAAFVLGKPASASLACHDSPARSPSHSESAAIQLLPMLARLADSPRAAGVSWEQSTAWSLPWQRVVELFFPTFFGDSSRPELALYFGWGIHDRDFPYLLLIAVGLPLLLLSLASWTRRDTPERASLALISLAGIFFALGRHNPAYRWVWSWLPGIDKLRFPEKFLLLTLTAAIFSGALAWQRLLDERGSATSGTRGLARGAELPLALAGLVTALAAGFALLAFRAPQLFTWFAREHSILPLGEPSQQRALEFYRHESLVAVGFALGACILFALVRFSRAPRRLLAASAIALVTLELWTYGHALVRTVPARGIFAPLLVAKSFPASVLRLFSDEAYQREKTGIVFTAGNPRLLWARASIERLDSRAGNLFGYAYALDKDFDLSLTRPAVRALRLLRADPRAPGARAAPAWRLERLASCRTQVCRRGRRRGARGGQGARADRAAGACTSERLRSSTVSFRRRRATLPRRPEAEAAAVADGLPLNRVEYLIAAGLVPKVTVLPEGRLDNARIRSIDDRGDQVHLGYSAERPALLVVASTFDTRWKAKSREEVLPLFETAAGYMAILVPAGEGEVELRFRDPWVSLGAAISATALLGACLLEVRSRRRDRGPRPVSA